MSCFNQESKYDFSVNLADSSALCQVEFKLYVPCTAKDIFVCTYGFQNPCEYINLVLCVTVTTHVRARIKLLCLKLYKGELI